MENTVCPRTFIESRGVADGIAFVVYKNADGERWVIRGECNCCGACEVGNNTPNVVFTGIPVGFPRAAIDTTFGTPERLDSPVRPELTRKYPSCTLKGEYLTHAD